MSRKIIIILSLLAIFLLAYFCIKTTSPAIEDDLVTQSDAALASEGMVWADVSTDGRELLLTGVAPTEGLRTQAGDIARNIWGVRTVDNQLTVEPVAATEAQGSDLSLKDPYSLTEFNVEIDKAEPDAVHVAAIDCQKLFNDMLSNQKIYFEVSRARIRSDSDAFIGRLADVALKCPDTKIEVAGHTDSSGPRAMNQKLSEMRASAVVQRLIVENVSADRLMAVGYGEMEPIADNTTDEGRAENRRIEFNILGD